MRFEPGRSIPSGTYISLWRKMSPDEFGSATLAPFLPFTSTRTCASAFNPAA